MTESTYVIISPCRDEAEFMEQTLESVVNQSVVPNKWVIVDDGSTDRTPQILEEYSKNYDFIEIVTRKDRGERSVGPGVIDAFYAGLSCINIEDFDFICKLDLDLVMPVKYFELMIKEMEQRPRLGAFSGKTYYIDDATGKHVSEGVSDEATVGAAKFYRTTCFKQIGGFVRQVMWDGIDMHRCRLLGWISESRDDVETRFIHLRPMGSSHKGILTGRVRHGFGQYFMGTGLLYMLASTVYKVPQPPVVIGSLASLWGYIRSAISGVERLNDPNTVKLMKDFQIRSIFLGKKKSVNYINKRQESKWDPKGEHYEIPYNKKC